MPDETMVGRHGDEAQSAVLSREHEISVATDGCASGVASGMASWFLSTGRELLTPRLQLGERADW